MCGWREDRSSRELDREIVHGGRGGSLGTQGVVVGGVSSRVGERGGMVCEFHWGLCEFIKFDLG